jgi:HSP20 family molecular chaperone IbpA
MRDLALWSRPFETDRWLHDFFSPTTVSDWLLPTPSGFSPAAEITKDGDDAVVRIELPGVDVDKDVTVELHGGHLIIRGERRDEHASDDAAKDGHVLREVRYGAFRRSFTVPAHVTSDAISASYGAGVLTVRVAGVYAGTQAQRIAITK